MAAGEGPVTCRVGDDGVAAVRLARPDKLNALDAATFAGLVAAGERLAGDRSVRAVVLAGEGRAFCAGLDLSLFGGGGPAVPGGGDILARLPGRITNLFQQAAWVWAELPVPTVAAVHGVALGGGLQIAMAADVRIVAPDARLSVMEIRWGLVPDMTGTWTLPRLVGPDRAKELTWSGRMVGGEEAVRLGLATRVADDPLAAATDLARDLAGRNPDAVVRSKALLDGALGAGPAEQFLAESRHMQAVIGSANQREAVAAALESRPAVFADRADGGATPAR